MGNIFLINTQFEIFEQLSTALCGIIDNAGQKLLSSNSEVKKLDRKIKLRLMNEVEIYLAISEKLLQNLDTNTFRKLPTAIVSELQTLHREFNQNLAKIRTIRSVYKLPQFMEKIGHHLNRGFDWTTKILTATFQRFLNRTPMEAELETAAFSLGILDPSQNWIQIWYTLENFKYTTFTIHLTKDSWLKPTDELSFVLNMFQGSFKRKSEQDHPPTLQEILNSPLVHQHPTLMDLEFTQEFLYYLIHLHVLIPHPQTDFTNKIQKREILKQIEEYLYSMVNYFIAFKGNGIGIHYPAEEMANPLKDFPPFIRKLLAGMQDASTSEDPSQLSDVQKKMQNLGKDLFSLLKELDQYIHQFKDFVAPWTQIIRKFENAIKQIRGGLSRQLDDFEQYVRSVRENRQKMELDEILKLKNRELDALLLECQEKVAPYFEDKKPEVQSILDTMKTHREKVDVVKKTVDKIFKEYTRKEVNLNPYIKAWEGKNTDLTNQSQFFIKSLVSLMIKRYEEILNSETDVSLSSDSPSTHLINPNRLTKQELRERIQKLEGHINSSTQLISDYKKEKSQLVVILEEKLNVDGLKSKKCIICHKIVNVAEDHFIRCEFCEALSHYTCNAMWLSHYNSCPVCSHQYTLPNNEIYDPEKLSR